MLRWASSLNCRLDVYLEFTDNLVDPTTVNNVEKGQGSGPSKQLAKEEAAKQAFYAMGWSA